MVTLWLEPGRIGEKNTSPWGLISKKRGKCFTGACLKKKKSQESAEEGKRGKGAGWEEECCKSRLRLELRRQENG